MVVQTLLATKLGVVCVELGERVHDMAVSHFDQNTVSAL